MDRRLVSKALGYMVVGASIVTSELVLAADKRINGVRIWHSPDKTRLVFDVSGSVKHSELTLSKPDRLVIDVADTTLKTSFKGLVLKDTPVKQIRHGLREGNNLRVVLDLSSKVTSKSFLLKPNSTYGHRLVVDLYDGNTASKPIAQPKPKGLRDIVVAIDAGHGGEDPGAIAYGGGYEKHVTLAISKQLAAMINKERGFKAVLVRTGDYYIDLRRRTRIARENNADLFVSVHADAFSDRRANGASVYALSRRGATSETARWLAQKENASDQIGGEDGISLSDKDDVLAGVLLDLSMTSTLSSSLEVGDKVLRNMSAINRLHKKQVEQAAFAVLKSPDIPSILVETGFISNPTEAKKLKNSRHQRDMALAIFKGLKYWFHQKPPPDTLVAKWKQNGALKSHPDRYVVQAGDTLSEIADQFDISTTQLKKVNQLSSANNIRVGQVLVIPN
ncbi:N-acetylmuramoyl-L-alanine amidase [Endozoicomonas sp. (ex Bugula neritina AB1)]|nr:N-acetylmuramoyl-L-alanine amidase [Endozoicomonas sp. (ex Bugula neritina AB1)]